MRLHLSQKRKNVKHFDKETCMYVHLLEGAAGIGQGYLAHAPSRPLSLADVLSHFRLLEFFHPFSKKRRHVHPNLAKGLKRLRPFRFK